MPQQLAPALVDNILAKLGLSDKPPINPDGLGILYAAWCRQVPFDNTRKLIHINAGDPTPLPGDDATDFFESWLKHGTGSTCWGGNGALQALLESVGFAAARGVATMMVAPDLPPNHGTVVVTFDSGDYLVDASILHELPLHLDESAPPSVDNLAWGVRTAKPDANWLIAWRPLMRAEGINCRVEYVPATQEDFRRRHEASRSWSPFNYQLNNRLIKGDSVIGAAFGERVEIDRNGQIHKKPLTHEQRIAFLVEELGISEEMAQRVPPDRPTPPPPGSETAKRLTTAEKD